MTGRHRAEETPRKRSARVTESSDFVAFLLRIHVAWRGRVAHDPVILAHLRDLAASLENETNRGIFLANKQGRYSQNEIARIMGLTRQAVAHRIKLGEAIHAAAVAAEGGAPVIRLGLVRADRARLLELAGVADRTGSDKEVAAGRAVGQ